jgi:alpha-L-fucosidase 2
MGPTIDMQLLRYLFDATIEASRLLNVDAEFRRELSEKRQRLAPTRIGSDGRVMEWLEEYKEADPTHRHISHLWGLYPGFEINRRTTPALVEAARKSLEARGDVSTGWSLAHKITLWARVGDGDRAGRLLSILLSPVGSHAKDGVQHGGGGSYENLFDAHPPFQIDGNFGAAAGIAEMLMQSDKGFIELLPALPATWPNGKVIGLRARDGYEVSLEWSGGKLTDAQLKSRFGGSSVIRYGPKTISLTTRPGKTYAIASMLN